MAGKFTLEAVFRAVDKMSAPVKRMASGLEKFQKKASKGLADLDASVSKVTGGLKAMAAVAAVVGTAAGAVALNVGKTGADFEQAMSAVGAVSLQSRGQIHALEEQALSLGATTVFSATEVANAMETMARAGFKNSEIMQGVPGVLDAAAASGLEIAEVAGVVSNALKGMGLQASDASRVADVLALASARTNSTIGTLGESMKNLAPVARQLNVPFEQAVAAVALLQDVGLDASEAGTATATMLSKLAKPSKEAASEMAALGVKFQDAKGNMLPLNGILSQFDKAAKKSGGNAKVLAFFTELVGLRGQKAALNLKDLFTSGKLSTLSDELDHAAGTAGKMAELRLDNFLGDVEQLGGAFDSLKIALFQTQSGPLRGVVQGLTEWLDANQEIIKSGFVEFVTKAIPIVKGFGEGLIGGFREAMPYIKGASEVLGKLFGDQAIGAQAQAYFWGKRIAYMGEALFGLVIAVNVARGAVFAFGVVTRGVQVATFVFTTAIKGAQAALILYETWSKAGAVGTLALQFASKAAAADMLIARASAFAASGGFTALAGAAGAAAAAIGAIYLAWDQLQKFMDENGGFEGLKAFVGLSDQSNNWGFAGVDDVMNTQAMERKVKHDEFEKATSGDRKSSLFDDSRAAAVDKVFGAGSQPKGFGFDGGPRAAEGGTPSPTAPQPQVSSPWEGVAPQDMRDLFKSTIDINLKDPGKTVDSVDVKNPGKTLAPVNPRSGSNK